MEEFKDLLYRNMGYEVVEQEGDGNCLFRAISHQVYGDSSMHHEVRQRVMDYMDKNEEHFSQFVCGTDDYEESFPEYVARKRFDGVHGNHVEIQAISELYNRPVEVYSPENGLKPMNIFHTEYKTSDQPLRLSYHDGNHYNSVVDPLCPTAGLGLGLPGLQPGLADKLQMKDAIGESERLELDRLYVSQAIRESEEEWSRREAMMYKEKAAALAAMDDEDNNHPNAEDYELEQAILQSSLEAYNNAKKQSRPSVLSAVASGRSSHTSHFGNHHHSARSRWPRTNHSTQSSAFHSQLQPTYSQVLSRPATSGGEIAHGSSGTGSSVAAASAQSSSPRTATSVDPAAIGDCDDAAVARSSAANSSVDKVVAADALAASEYPETVTELVMNGFELGRVLRAYELIGDNFDDLLGFLISSG